MARKMSANMAHTLAIHRAVYPLGQSTFTAAWKRTAHTSQSVRHSENLCSLGVVICGPRRVSRIIYMRCVEYWKVLQNSSLGNTVVCELLYDDASQQYTEWSKKSVNPQHSDVLAEMNMEGSHF